MEVAGDPPDAALRPALLPRPISDGRISSVDVGPGAAVLPDAELVELPGATLLLSGDRSPVVPPLLCGLAGHAQPPGDIGPGDPAPRSPVTACRRVGLTRPSSGTEACQPGVRVGQRVRGVA